MRHLPLLLVLPVLLPLCYCNLTHCHCQANAVSPPATAKAVPIASTLQNRSYILLAVGFIAADHATTLQVPSTNTAKLPMVDATCNVWRCWMHASTAIELNPQVFACATLHAKSWCLFVCHLYTMPGKEGPGSTTPGLHGCGSASGLMLATTWPGSKTCLNHLFRYTPTPSSSCLLY